jgi:putative addiction module component (TIGR02574 family)
MASRSLKGRREAARRRLAEPEGFGSLSKAEQIRYLQALWDRISEQPGELAVPKSHLSLAKERLAEYRRDPTRARPARDVLRRLATRHR